MVAGGTNGGSLGTYHDVAAVSALPNLDLALGKDLCHFHIVKQRSVALLVVLLNGRHQAEFGRQLREALLLGSLGKALIHISPLVVLALGSGEQILGGRANALQLLEPHLGVLFFIVGGFQKQRCDLLVALLLCGGSKKGILVSGLGFAGEGLQQILLGLCACILAHDESFLSK